MGARLEVDRTCYTTLPITSLPSSSGRECRSRALHSCFQGLIHKCLERFVVGLTSTYRSGSPHYRGLLQTESLVDRLRAHI
jgi:hypothetical protein